MPKKLLELKADIGHYGGYFVQVPKGDVKSFKSLFGSSFPKGSKRIVRWEPSQKHDVFFFAERTKGIRRLDELNDKRFKLKFPDYGD